MKPLLFLLLISSIVLQGCYTFERRKISRTVSKTINLNFSINQVGNFQSFRLIAGRDIIDLFDPTTNSIASAEIQQIDIKSVKIGANIIKPANTATEVVLSTDVLSGALLNQPTRLLNETKKSRLEVMALISVILWGMPLELPKILPFTLHLLFSTAKVPLS